MLGFDVRGAGFLPSGVLSFEDPRMLKDCLESDVDAITIFSKARIPIFL